MKLKLKKTVNTTREDCTLVKSELFTIDQYTIHRITYTYTDNEVYESVWTYLNDEHERFAPSIYLHSPIIPDIEERRFEIQTTSYGTLKLEEFDEFLAAQKKARKVAQILTDFFIHKGKEV